MRREFHYRLRAACAAQLTEGLHHRKQGLSSTIVRNNHNQWGSGCALEIWNQQGFCCGNQSGQTNTPRGGSCLPPTLFKIRGRLLKSRALFHVRQDFADEGKDHVSILKHAAISSQPHEGFRNLRILVQRVIARDRENLPGLTTKY